MLTKADLLQLRKIIREEVEAEAKSNLETIQAEIKLSRIELQKEIKDLAKRIKNLEIIADKIQKNVKLITNFFDKEQIELTKKIRRIEQHLNLSSA